MDAPPIEAKDVLDEIGYWSEVKLEILRKIATAYSTILARQPYLHHVYIDAFAGRGIHIARRTGEVVTGSPLNALRVEPPFEAYYFMDLNTDKIGALKSAIGDRPDVHVLAGDSNELLLSEVFPTLTWESYNRAFCFLDPYGLQVRWDVIAQAGALRTVDICLNFSVLDMNRNVLWRDPERVTPKRASRLDRFWGDSSWRNIAYRTDTNLFGAPEKTDNETIAAAFAERLHRVAGFAHVSEPVPMRNSRGAVLYYLVFASQKAVGVKIARDVCRGYST